MRPTYNRLRFDYGYDGDALQEIVDGRQTRILDFDGNLIDLPEQYGCSVVAENIATPDWAPLTPDQVVELPAPPEGFAYALVPNV